MDWFEDQADPVKRQRAKQYAEMLAEQRLAQADYNPTNVSARRQGNVLTYWSIYIGIVPGTAPASPQREAFVLPDGSVVREKATFYSEKGAWKVHSDGSMVLRQSDGHGGYKDTQYMPDGTII